MIEKVLQKIQNSGQRITPQRRVMIQKIAEAGRLLTAAEIWQLVRQQYKDVGLDTIYRNVKMLVNLGVLTSIEGVTGKGVRYELTDGHHHHITCVNCGETMCIDYCPIGENFQMEMRSKGFQLIRHNLEFFGLCDKCCKRRTESV